MKRFALLGGVLGFVLGANAAFVNLQGLAGYLILILVSGWFLFRHKKLHFFIGFLALGLAFSFIKIGDPFLYGARTGMVIFARQDYFIFQSALSRYYVYSKGHGYELGDILKIDGLAEELSFSSYESRFDFGDYLLRRGVRAELNINQVEEIFLTPFRLVDKMYRFKANFSDTTGALLLSLLFGIKDYDVAIIARGDAIGCLYFLSASGLYYGLFLKGLEKLTGIFSIKYSKRVALVIGALYLPLALSKPSILRVYLVYLFTYLDKKRHKDAREKAAIVLLLFNPYYAMSQSFISGFLISYGLSLGSGYIHSRKRNRKYIGTLFLYLFLLPSFSMGSEIHLFSPLYSALLVPMFLPFAALGAISFLTFPFTALLNGYGSVLDNVINILDRLDTSVPFVDLSNYTVFYYLAIFALMYLFEIGFLKYLRTYSFGLSGCLLLLLVPVSQPISGEVAFIDVGQGDSILVRSGTHSMLVDTGGSLSFDMAEEVLIPYLRKKKVYSLEYLVITHGDFDHDGAKDSLLENFKVGALLTSHRQFPIRLGNMEISSLSEGGFGDGNEDSLVLRFDLGGTVYLLTGDAGIKAEAKILDKGLEVDCDILKLGHHGSDTSSSLSFLKAASPKEAVISCGEGNRYGHPHESVLHRCQSLGISIRRTDEEGTIEYRHYGLSYLGLLDFLLPIRQEEAVISN